MEAKKVNKKCIYRIQKKLLSQELDLVTSLSPGYFLVAKAA